MEQQITERLDTVLVKTGVFSSRERAREQIIKGNILVNGVKTVKCGKKIDLNSKIEFIGQDIPYVSRGGLKLEKAINAFHIDLKHKVCLDIGASTGGFTDCMLQNGATKVYAIDVGTDQLHESLKNDSRVISMEQCNIREVTEENIKDKGDFASIDVSFISLSKVIPYVVVLLKDKGEIMALIKPQFEAGKSNLNKKGVVKNPKIHKLLINDLLTKFKEEGLNIKDFSYSPVKGPNGNIEYLIYLSKDSTLDKFFDENRIKEIVEEAFVNLQ